MNTYVFPYLIHLADNALILGQRNSEWTGHGPVLEQDIAITNISLDLLGQARNLYQYAATVYNNLNKEEKKEVDHLIPRPWKKFNRDLEEDDLAFLRDEHQYLNLLLVELPKGDWAQTVLRQFFFSAFQLLQYTRLQKSIDTQLSAIAEKSIKEVTYHLRWSSEWVIRLGDGTEESNRRIRVALNNLWSFTGEMWQGVSFEVLASKDGTGTDTSALRDDWNKRVQDIFTQATLDPVLEEKTKTTWMQQGGKEGKHTEHLGFLLAEMQYLQRTYPDVTW